MASLNTLHSPRLGVQESFLDLLRSEPLVLKTCLVAPHTLDHQSLVFFRKALCFHGRIWHPIANEETPEDGQSSICDEKGLPRFQGSVIELGKRVCKKPPNDLLPSIHHVPVRYRLSLLFPLVPHTAQEQKAGLTNGLENTEQRPQREDTGKAVGNRVQCKNCAPEHDVQGEIFGDRHSLNRPIGGIFNRQHCNVYAGRQPRVLVVVSELLSCPS